MFSPEFRTREYGGRVVVKLRGALDAAEAARLAAALMAVPARTPEILAGLEFRSILFLRGPASRSPRAAVSAGQQQTRTTPRCNR